MPRVTRSSKSQDQGVPSSTPPTQKPTKPARKPAAKPVKPVKAAKTADPPVTALPEAPADSADLEPTEHQMAQARAGEQIAVLASAGPWIVAGEDLKSELNAGAGAKPPRGAFEVDITREDGRVINVWSGLKRGPPRKAKFPEANVLLAAVRQALNQD
eukprot:maker-scaffold722_size106786-snap-gene-0.24 protein:Tk04292 transcript:maker-scaffold722_size106786-snap-gene-0.24-mRNA-1 annotation:"hypothetical protein TRIADDRAFT_56553"